MPAAADLSAPLRNEEIARLFAPLRRFSHVALAVSGGADSTALMLTAARWRDLIPDPPRITVLTVDHALRPESREEVRLVCERAQALGLACHILRREGPRPRSGVQQAAREARYALLGDWCAGHGAALITAHHLEDQAETFLMRLARGSGVDGLAAMSTETFLKESKVTLLRPFLDIPRARLGATVRAAGMDWIEDPSNADATYERVRMRRLLPRLAEAGIAPRDIATSCRRLHRASEALEQWSASFLSEHLVCHVTHGWGEVPLQPLLQLPQEVRLRIFASLLHTFGHPRRLRLAAMERLDDWLLHDTTRAHVLGGARLVRRRRVLVIGREPGRLHAQTPLEPDQEEVLWDGRFLVRVPVPHPPLVILPLGSITLPEDFPDRPSGVPAFAWRTLPVICSAKDRRPLACPATDWRAARSEPAEAVTVFRKCNDISG
ncbi:MAG TPA: tRNA lysidine(34) synthetase TilS [Bryobacterales bacterium]|nr:tRNA lysidine(34) synthetase TilS [Bryobacterales bacterium]